MRRIGLFFISLLLILSVSVGSAQTPAPKPSGTKPKPVVSAKPAPQPSQAPVTPASKQPQTPGAADPIVLTNQMMITIMERMKGGYLEEAKKIALDMIIGNEKFVDTPTKEFKTFSTAMGKKLYEYTLAKQGRKGVEVVWLPQPIADGFYFLSMIAFQQGKPEEALGYLQKAINWDPVRAAFHVERGFMLANQPNPPERAQILVTYLRALELADNPADFAAALRGVGFIQIEKSDLEAALACYVQSLRFEPGNKAANQEISYIQSIAPDLVHQIDQKKASAILADRKIRGSYDPLHVQILLLLAEEIGGVKAGKEVKALLHRALQMDPNNAQAKQKLAGMK